MAHTEGITITGADTVGDIVSTVTSVTALWRADINREMQVNREELLRTERDHAKRMSFMQQMTDTRIDQVQTEWRDSGQCYRALLQENGEAVSHVTNTVRWNTNKTEKIQVKIDFIIEHTKVQMEQESWEQDPLQQGRGEVWKEQQEFYQDIDRLEERIDMFDRATARDTSMEHTSCGATFSPATKGRLPEQELGDLLYCIELITDPSPTRDENNM